MSSAQLAHGRGYSRWLRLLPAFLERSVGGDGGAPLAIVIVEGIADLHPSIRERTVRSLRQKARRKMCVRVTNRVRQVKTKIRQHRRHRSAGLWPLQRVYQT